MENEIQFEENKVYRTKGGDYATIHHVIPDSNYTYRLRGSIMGQAECWMINGSYFDCAESTSDLVPGAVSDYDPDIAFPEEAAEINRIQTIITAVDPASPDGDVSVTCIRRGNEILCLLPEGSAERKDIPITTGVLDYFPLAIAAVAQLSKIGNDKHNPGEPLHWAREKSTDHADCIARHLIDRGKFAADGTRHSAALAWRALALLQTELESERE